MVCLGYAFQLIIFLIQRVESGTDVHGRQCNNIKKVEPLWVIWNLKNCIGNVILIVCLILWLSCREGFISREDSFLIKDTIFNIQIWNKNVIHKHKDK